MDALSDLRTTSAGLIDMVNRFRYAVSMTRTTADTQKRAFVRALPTSVREELTRWDRWAGADVEHIVSWCLQEDTRQRQFRAERPAPGTFSRSRVYADQRRQDAPTRNQYAHKHASALRATEQRATPKTGYVSREERDRRFRENLCLACGKEGHQVIDCPERAKGGRGRDERRCNDRGRNERRNPRLRATKVVLPEGDNADNPANQADKEYLAFGESDDESIAGL